MNNDKKFIKCSVPIIDQNGNIVGFEHIKTSIELTGEVIVKGIDPSIFQFETPLPLGTCQTRDQMRAIMMVRFQKELDAFLDSHPEIKRNEPEPED